MRVRSAAAAVTVMLYVSATGGILLWGAALVVEGAGERVLEALSVLPRDWGLAHGGGMALAALATAVPLTLAFAGWIFRRAVAIESTME